ncbi:flagellar assembly protein [Sulfodiicoccus acidiphilus]|uniref:Flagellar assembly protein n=2 Tax=Sulfodiicoccus acidiphilus TaxID=1670455 RepID=A0A830H1N1_9CREN|nr:flagellar assembly protein [Sulfodiicoccus acidiphilus]
MIFYDTSLAKSLAKSLEPKLRKAGIPDDPQLYASKLLFYTTVSIVPTVLMVTLSVVVIDKLYLPTRVPKYLLGSLILVALGILIPPITYFVQQVFLSQRIYEREVGITSETPVFSSLFVIFLRSGLSPRILFENVSRVQAFEHVRGLSSYVSKRVRYLGEGVEEAVLKTLDVSPSKLFNDFMSTYVLAIRTGAPVLQTMEAKMRDVADQVRVMAAGAADRLQGVAEGYIIWLASGYISIFLVVILGALFPSGGSTATVKLMEVVAVILIPLVNLMFVLMADQTQFKFPEKGAKAYRVFAYSFPAGLIVSFGILVATHELVNFVTLSGVTQDLEPVMTALLVGLLVASIPPAYVNYLEEKRATGYEQYAARLLRSVAEGIRAGLSPEGVVQKVKDAPEMGKLRPVLNNVTALLKLGVPLKDAFRRASEGMMEFYARVSVISLADMIEVGSMTPETVNALAEQLETQLAIRRDYKNKVRVLLFTPYVGVILALVASVLLSFSILGLLGSHSLISSYGPLAAASQILPNVVFASGISSMFNAFFAGFLVGKIATGRVSAGFVHSAVLVVVTAVILVALSHVNISFVSTQAPSL